MTEGVVARVLKEMFSFHLGVEKILLSYFFSFSIDIIPKISRILFANGMEQNMVLCVNLLTLFSVA